MQSKYSSLEIEAGPNPKKSAEAMPSSDGKRMAVGVIGVLLLLAGALVVAEHGRTPKGTAKLGMMVENSQAKPNGKYTKVFAMHLAGNAKIHHVKSKLLHGHGFRHLVNTISYRPFELLCKKPRTSTYLSGFDIAVGPNTRLKAHVKSSGSLSFQARVTTWADSKNYGVEVGYFSTCAPQSSVFMTSFLTHPKYYNWDGKVNPKFSKVFRLPCKVHPKVFGALNHLDIGQTKTVNARLRMSTSISKMSGGRAKATVKFHTWAGSRIYVAGASVVAFCPLGDFIPQLMQTGVAMMTATHTHRMWVGKGIDTETVYVKFKKWMWCEKPTVTVGLTHIDFLHSKNYRLIVQAKDVTDMGFNAVFRTWWDTGVWAAEIAYIAVCPL